MRVLKDLLLLIFSAVEVLVLLSVLRDSVTRRGHFQAAAANIIPVDILEEGMALDFTSSTSTCTKTLAWITVEEMYNQVFRFLRHAHGQLEHATLYVVE